MSVLKPLLNHEIPVKVTRDQMGAKTAGKKGTAVILGELTEKNYVPPSALLFQRHCNPQPCIQMMQCELALLRLT